MAQRTCRGTLARVTASDDDTSELDDGALEGVGGGEPDYRFTLANERTFLAWVRTSLALLAGGVAIRFIAQSDDLDGGRRGLAVAAIVLSAIVVVLAYRRWSEVQQAMRERRPLPSSVGIPLLTVTIAAVAVAAAIVVLL